MVRTLAFFSAVLLALGVAIGAGIWYSTAPSQTTRTTAAGDSHVAVKPVAGDPQDPPPSPELKLPAGLQIRFREVTKEAGIDFRHFDSHTDMEYIMDQTGSGLAWLDYDQDGLMDLFFVQDNALIPPYPKSPPTCKLYKNLGRGKFVDVTDKVGLGH